MQKIWLVLKMCGRMAILLVWRGEGRELQMFRVSRNVVCENNIRKERESIYDTNPCNLTGWNFWQKFLVIYKTRLHGARGKIVY